MMDLDKEKAQSILNTLKRPDFSESLELAKELVANPSAAVENPQSDTKRTFLRPKGLNRNPLLKILALVLVLTFIVLGYTHFRSQPKKKDLMEAKPSDPQIVVPLEQSDPNSSLKPPTRPQRN